MAKAPPPPPPRATPNVSGLGFDHPQPTCPRRVLSNVNKRCAKESLFEGPQRRVSISSEGGTIELSTRKSQAGGQKITWPAPMSIDLSFGTSTQHLQRPGAIPANMEMPFNFQPIRWRPQQAGLRTRTIPNRAAQTPWKSIGIQEMFCW